jgi:hypothetical protein
MNRMRSTALLVAVAVGTGLVFGTDSILGATVTSAVVQCSAKTLDGNYGYVVTGTNVGGALVPGPVVAVGSATADGAGHLSATDTVSVNGTILRRAISGAYTVNANCTGQLTFTDNFGQTTNLDFVAVQNGREFSLIQTDIGAVTTGTAKKQ